MKAYLSIALLICSLNAFSQNALTDSLIAYYPFNGNANDVSGNGNNGTPYGATLTTDRFGNANSAYYFNGISDYILYKSNRNFKPATFPISITVWIKSSLNSGQVTVFDNDHTDNVYGGVNLTLGYNSSTSGSLTLTFGDGIASAPGDRISKSASFNLNDNQWHFIAGVVHSPTDIDLFIDCNYVSGTFSGSAQQFEYTNSGGLAGTNNSSTSPIYYYKGSIGETRLYHRSLTQSDLEAIYSFPRPYKNYIPVSFGPDTAIGCNSSSVILSPTVSSNNPLSYSWSDHSTASSLVVTQPGIYAVTVSDGCHLGTDSTHVILKGVKQTRTIASSSDNICIGSGRTSLLTTDNNFGNLQWQSSVDAIHFSSIPGATLDSYTTPPALAQATFYRLVSSSACSDTSNIVVVHIVPSPYTFFTYSFNNGLATFNSSGTSPDVTSYHWDFSDDSTSSLANPIHQFNMLDTFYVCLTVYNNSNCSYTYCEYITAASGVNTISGNNFIQLYPNPAANTINLSAGELQGKYQLRIYNVLGQEVQAINDLNLQDKQTIPIELNDVPAGVYQLILSGNNNFFNNSFIHFK